MTSLIVAHLVLAGIGLLVVGFVAFPYRGRAVPRALPRSDRLNDRLQDFAGRLDPADAPPLGVLTTPEKSRAMSERFERAESKIKRGLRAAVPAGRE